MNIQIKSKVKVQNGYLIRVSHQSVEINSQMTFAVYLPDDDEKSSQTYPVLMYLSGLTCTDENVCQKSGIFKYLQDSKIGLIAPDTSPRGLGILGENDSWDFGTGAGFYLDATVEPWSLHYRMYSYITKELPSVVASTFHQLDTTRDDRMSLCGHSMGGHGALTISLKNPTMFRSVSAFAPICNPINCPLGIKAFTGYLGNDINEWKKYDACELLRSIPISKNLEFLIDFGTKDENIGNGQLLPQALEEAVANQSHHNFTIRYQIILNFIKNFFPHDVEIQWKLYYNLTAMNQEESVDTILKNFNTSSNPSPLLPFLSSIDSLSNLFSLYEFILYKLTATQKTILFCNKEGISACKSCIKAENLAQRVVHVHFIGRILISVWEQLHFEDSLEGLTGGFESYAEALKIKEDFIDMVHDVFKEFALGTIGKAVDSDGVTLTEDIITLFHCYGGVCAVLLSIGHRYQTYLAEWSNALIGKTRFVSRNISESKELRNDFTRISFLPLIKTVLEIAFKDPYLIRGRCESNVSYRNNAILLVNHFIGILLMDLSLESSPLIQLETIPEESYKSAFNFSMEQDVTFESRTQMIPISLYSYISSWISCTLLPIVTESLNTSEVCLLISDLIGLTQHPFLTRLRQQISCTLLQKILYIIEDDIDQLTWMTPDNIPSIPENISTYDTLTWLLLLLRYTTPSENVTYQFPLRILKSIFKVEDDVVKIRLFSEFCFQMVNGGMKLETKVDPVMINTANQYYYPTMEVYGIDLTILKDTFVRSRLQSSSSKEAGFFITTLGRSLWLLLQCTNNSLKHLQNELEFFKKLQNDSHDELKQATASMLAKLEIKSPAKSEMMGEHSLDLLDVDIMDGLQSGVTGSRVPSRSNSIADGEMFTTTNILHDEMNKIQRYVDELNEMESSQYGSLHYDELPFLSNILLSSPFHNVAKIASKPMPGVVSSPTAVTILNSLGINDVADHLKYLQYLTVVCTENLIQCIKAVNIVLTNYSTVMKWQIRGVRGDSPQKILMSLIKSVGDILLHDPQLMNDSMTDQPFGKPLHQTNTSNYISSYFPMETRQIVWKELEESTEQFNSSLDIMLDIIIEHPQNANSTIQFIHFYIQNFHSIMKTTSPALIQIHAGKILSYLREEFIFQRRMKQTQLKSITSNALDQGWLGGGNELNRFANKSYLDEGQYVMIPLQLQGVEMIEHLACEVAITSYEIVLTSHNLLNTSHPPTRSSESFSSKTMSERRMSSSDVQNLNTYMVSYNNLLVMCVSFLREIERELLLPIHSYTDHRPPNEMDTFKVKMNETLTPSLPLLNQLDQTIQKVNTYSSKLIGLTALHLPDNDVMISSVNPPNLTWKRKFCIDNPQDFMIQNALLNSNSTLLLCDTKYVSPQDPIISTTMPTESLTISGLPSTFSRPSMGLRYDMTDYSKQVGFFSPTASGLLTLSCQMNSSLYMNIAEKIHLLQDLACLASSDMIGIIDDVLTVHFPWYFPCYITSSHLGDDIDEYHVKSNPIWSTLHSMEETRSLNELSLTYNQAVLSPFELNWQQLNGSADILTVLGAVTTESHHSYVTKSLSTLVHVKVFNSSGFKIPNFSLQLMIASIPTLVAYHVKDSGSSLFGLDDAGKAQFPALHPTTLSAVFDQNSIRMATGIDYFAPGSYIQRTFRFEIISFSAVNIKIRLEYPDLSYEYENDLFDAPLFDEDDGSTIDQFEVDGGKKAKKVPFVADSLMPIDMGWREDIYATSQGHNSYEVYGAIGKNQKWNAIIDMGKSLHVPISCQLIPYGDGLLWSLSSWKHQSIHSSPNHFRGLPYGGIPMATFYNQWNRLIPHRNQLVMEVEGQVWKQTEDFPMENGYSSWVLKELDRHIRRSQNRYNGEGFYLIGMESKVCTPQEDVTAKGTSVLNTFAAWSMQTLWGEEVIIKLILPPTVPKFIEPRVETMELNWEGTIHVVTAHSYILEIIRLDLADLLDRLTDGFVQLKE